MCYMHTRLSLVAQVRIKPLPWQWFYQLSWAEPLHCIRYICSTSWAEQDLFKVFFLAKQQWFEKVIKSVFRLNTVMSLRRWIPGLSPVSCVRKWVCAVSFRPPRLRWSSPCYCAKSGAPIRPLAHRRKEQHHLQFLVIYWSFTFNNTLLNEIL